MKLLRLFLQLLEASLGIYVDGILGDFALHILHVSHVRACPEVGA
jgi:hypothetical protein